MFTAPGASSADGLPPDGFEAWAATRPGLPAAGIAARVWAAATRYLAYGTTAIRVHVDIGGKVGLRSVQALLDVRAALAGIMDIQIVAVTSAPVTGRAGAASRALLRRALAAGADMAGFAPALDDETGRAVEGLAVVAADAGTGLDLQIDESVGPALVMLPRLIAIAEAGFGYPITASHVVSLGMKVQERRHAARSLADAGIDVVTLPRSSPCGGGTAVGAPRSLTAVRDLLQAGVPVAAGGDNLQEPTSPIGRADPLETASLLLTAARVTLAEALTAVTSAGRQIMRLPGVTVTQGSPADLVAIRAADLGSAMASGTADRIVLRGGQIVARGLTATELGLLELHITRSAWNLVGFLPRAPSIR